MYGGKLKVLKLAAAFLCAALPVVDVLALPIDDFSTEQTLITSVKGEVKESTVNNAGSLGKRRRVKAKLLSGTSFGVLVSSPLLPGIFSFQSITNSKGTSSMFWNLNPDDLGPYLPTPINLKPNNEDRFVLKVDSFGFKNNSQVEVLIRLYRLNPIDRSVLTAEAKALLSRVYNNELLEIPFAAFKTDDPLKPFEFMKAELIELTINGGYNSGMTLDCFETSNGVNRTCRVIEDCDPSLKTCPTKTPAKDCDPSLGKPCPTPIKTPAVCIPDQTRSITCGTPIATITATPRITASRTATPRTPTPTATVTTTATPTKTPVTPTITPTRTATRTSTRTNTPLPPIDTITPTVVPTLSATETPFIPPVYEEIPPVQFVQTTTTNTLKLECKSAEVYAFSATSNAVIRVSSTSGLTNETAWSVPLGTPKYQGKVFKPIEMSFSRISDTKKTLWAMPKYQHDTGRVEYGAKVYEYTFGVIRIDISSPTSPKLTDQILGVKDGIGYLDFYDDEAAYKLSSGINSASLSKFNIESGVWDRIPVDLSYAEGKYWKILATDVQSWPHILVARILDTTVNLEEPICMPSPAVVKQKIEVKAASISSSGVLTVGQLLEEREYETAGYDRKVSGNNIYGTLEISCQLRPEARNIGPGESGCLDSLEMMFHSLHTNRRYWGISNYVHPVHFSYDHKSGKTSYIVKLRSNYSISHQITYNEHCGYTDCKWVCNNGSPCSAPYGSGCLGCNYHLEKNGHGCVPSFKGYISKLEVTDDPYLKGCVAEFTKNVGGTVKCDGNPVQGNLSAPYEVPSMEELVPYRDVYSIPVADKSGENKGQIHIDGKGSIQRFYRATDGNYIAISFGATSSLSKLVSLKSTGAIEWSSNLNTNSMGLGQIHYFQESDPSIFYIANPSGYRMKIIKFLEGTGIKAYQPDPYSPTYFFSLWDTYSDSIQAYNPLIGSTNVSKTDEEEPEYLISYFGHNGIVATGRSDLSQYAVETRNEDPYLPDKKFLNKLPDACSGGTCSIN